MSTCVARKYAASAAPTEGTVVGPDEQLLMLVVGGHERIVSEIERRLASHDGVAMAVVAVPHVDAALERLQGGGFDGLIVFDDLLGRTTLRRLGEWSRRVPTVCIVERVSLSSRAEVRAQLRQEGAVACLFAADLSGPLLEMAILHAVEATRATPMPTTTTGEVVPFNRALVSGFVTDQPRNAHAETDWGVDSRRAIGRTRGPSLLDDEFEGASVAWLSGFRQRDEVLEIERREQELQAAHNRGAFSLSFQPIVDLERGSLLGLDATIRWTGHNEPEALPTQTLEATPTEELTVQVGYWALETAVRHMVEWDRDFELDGQIALCLHLSPSQCSDRTFAARIESLLMTTGLESRCLRLVIDSAAIVSDLESTTRLIAALTDQGIGIWIDDFGVGTCSAEHLRGLAIEAVMLDPSLVAALDGTFATTGRLKPLVESVQRLGAKLIAKGVEKAPQANLLRWLGCQAGQGLLYAQPLAIGDAFAYLARDRADP